MFWFLFVYPVITWASLMWLYTKFCHSIIIVFFFHEYEFGDFNFIYLYSTLTKYVKIVNPCAHSCLQEKHYE